MSKGSVYFAHALWDNEVLIKIGFSESPRWRIGQLSSKTRPVHLICHVPGSMAHENALHQLFNTSRVHGEWFRPSRKMYRLMTECLSLGVLPAAVEEFGKAHAAMIEAKRADKAAERAAAEYFNDCYETRRFWDSGPFLMGKSRPAPSDTDWIDQMIGTYATEAA